MQGPSGQCGFELSPSHKGLLAGSGVSEVWEGSGDRKNDGRKLERAGHENEGLQKIMMYQGRGW